MTYKMLNLFETISGPMGKSTYFFLKYGPRVFLELMYWIMG